MAPTMNAADRYSASSRKPRPATLALIVLLHVAAIYGLAKAFAPDFTSSMEREVLTTFSVDVAEPEQPPPPDVEPTPDEGAQGAPGAKAVARDETAPEIAVPLRRDRPMPKTPSTGTDARSGAREAGEGTGAAGQGTGTGSGRGGGGTGNGNFVPTEAVKISGNIGDASDYPVPPGGRSARVGTSVGIALTVGTDGLPKSCRVFRPGPFPETNARTCALAMARFRFKPATDANGNPVNSTFGWEQKFFN